VSVTRTRTRGLVRAGLLGVVAATVATTLAAAIARGLGVELAVPAGGAAIPLAGIAVVTGFFALVGVVLALASRRWSARPAERFRAAAVGLTAASLVPPAVSGGTAGTVGTLLALHLVAAAVMVPTLTRALRA
jgi:hypothetical protein